MRQAFRHGMICTSVVFACAAAFGQSPEPDREAAFRARQRERAALLPSSPVIPETDVAGYNEIDAFIIDAWERDNLPELFLPPEVCDDATFLRRAYLDVIGAIPTIEEAHRFLDDPSPDKRTHLIDALLSREQDYADHWTPFWEDALVSSIVGVNAGMATHGSYTGFINKAFRSNIPFDLFAAQLLDPSLPGHQPMQIGSDNGRPIRIHFVLNETHTDTLQTAATVAQVFMGTAMKCASCHNHFENDEWPQKRFLSFASMFSKNDLEVIRCESKTGVMANAAFPFEIPGIAMELPADENERLAHVAKLLVDPLNPRFAKSIVNRLWKRYLGLGLFEPADDFRESIPASHPELLEWLAIDLMRHDYDLKRTIRLILTSRTYQLRHEPTLADTFDVGNPGAMRYFRSPSLRKLTAEQFLDSVAVAMRQSLESRNRTYRNIASSPLSRALGKPAVRNDVSTARSEEPAILQGLEYLNGEEYQRIVGYGPLIRDAMSVPDALSAADVLSLAALSRHPSPEQREALASYLAANWNARADATAAPREQVWVDDELPAGSSTQGEWKWIDAADATPASGTRSHEQGGIPSPRAQHFFLAPSGGAIGPNDVLFAEVWIEPAPADQPREIMLQWNDGTSNDGGWTHRAYWGEDVIPFGAANTESRNRLGDLPKAGAWVRLEIPASEVGLGETALQVIGMSFDQAGGRVRWDRVGVVSLPPSPLQHDVQDVLWALFTSAEFQYIK